MPLDVHLREPGTTNTGAFRKRGMGSGPIVYTDEAREWNASPKAFINDTNGSNLNVDASFGGTPVRVHDGIDSTLWTGNNVAGTTATFNSTNQAQAGTRSTEWLNPALASIIEYDKGTGSIAVNSYTAVTFYIYIDSNWGAGDEFSVYLYDQGTTSTIGNPLLVSSYINTSTTGSWQFVNIPMEDFAATGQTFDTIRFEVTARSGNMPDIYFDEIVIQETGGFRYSLGLEIGKSYLVDLLRVTIAGPRTAVKDPLKFFGLTLTTGITL